MLGRNSFPKSLNLRIGKKAQPATRFRKEFNPSDRVSRNMPVNDCQIQNATERSEITVDGLRTASIFGQHFDLQMPEFLCRYLIQESMTKQL